MSDEPGIKVNDKRMFTSTGELREEYRFLEDEARRPEPPPASAAPAPEPGAPAPAGVVEPAAAPGGSTRAFEGASAAPDLGTQRPPVEIPDAGLGPGGDAPSFYDLLAIVAEPVPFYLGDQPLPDGEVREDLQAARLYIDLLDVLRQKTAGNLTVQEANVLEDLLYRLRLRYVEKRG